MSTTRGQPRAVVQVASRRCLRNARLQVVSQAAAAPAKELKRANVPVELEDGPLPLNTFSPKKPFKAKIKSVERIVGPKATGETCHIIIETDGKIPFWEGQSYGVIPPVRPPASGLQHSRGSSGILCRRESTSMWH